MADVRLVLAGFGHALVPTGLAVFRRQAKATSCPRHSQLAGITAVVAGWLSLNVGIGLLAYSVWLALL